MDGMVEENGEVDPLAPSPDPPNTTSVGVTNKCSQLVATTNIIQLTLPAQNHKQAQVGVKCPSFCACITHYFIFIFLNNFISFNTK